MAFAMPRPAGLPPLIWDQVGGQTIACNLKAALRRPILPPQCHQHFYVLAAHLASQSTLIRAKLTGCRRLRYRHHHFHRRPRPRWLVEKYQCICRLAKCYRPTVPLTHRCRLKSRSTRRCRRRRVKYTALLSILLQGRPTTDPATALSGAQLPFGSHKVTKAMHATGGAPQNYGAEDARVTSSRDMHAYAIIPPDYLRLSVLFTTLPREMQSR